MKKLQTTSSLIGVLKWIAAQVIVAHHMAVYGPISLKGHVEMPGLFSSLSECGPWAVSVFLVISGFLTAKGIDQKTVDFQYIRHAMTHRYLRLAPVYTGGLLLSAGVALLFQPWVSPDMRPQHLDASTLLGNFLFLQDILGLESLSAGLWYVAIDLQLFALFLGLAFLSHLTSNVSKQLIWAAVGLLSLSYFNLHPEWNVWGIYFAGTYALGALVYQSPHLLKKNHAILFLYLAGAIVCAWLEPRPRLLVAILTATTLFGVQYISIDAAVWTTTARKMGDYSYGLFLSHFSMLMLVGCIYPVLAGWGIPLQTWVLAIFVCGNALGWFIWRYIDVPAQRILI